MAQTGYTPILLYSSSTASQAPSAGNLTNSTLGSELAINITDGKLFYKDNANAVQVIGWKVVPTSAGGTGLTSYAAGDLLYYATGTTLSKLAIGASTTILTSSGTAPQWSAASGITVGTATNLAGGLAGSVPYQSGAGATTFLGIGAANTVLTSSGSAPQWSTSLTLAGTINVGGSGGGNQVNVWGATGVGIRIANTSTGNSAYITSEASDKFQFNASGEISFFNGGSQKFGIGLTSATWNPGSLDYDWQFKGTSDANMMYLDASAGLVGFGTNAPVNKIDVRGSARLASDGIGGGTAANGVIAESISSFTKLRWEFYGGSANPWIGVNGASDSTKLLIGRDTTTWANFSAAGDLSIGNSTTTASEKLDVTGNIKASGAVNGVTAFRETNGNSTVANGATFTITIPSVRRPQLLCIYSGYNLYQGWYGLVKGDGAANAQANAIVNNGGLTVAGTAGNVITVTNNYGGTATIYWSLLPLGVAI